MLDFLNSPKLTQSRPQNETGRRFPDSLFKSGTFAGDQPSAATRLASRENFRDAVFLWITPRATPRNSSGCAFLSASAASAFLPVASADSTALMVVRMR